MEKQKAECRCGPSLTDLYKDNGGKVLITSVSEWGYGGLNQHLKEDPILNFDMLMPPLSMCTPTQCKSPMLLTGLILFTSSYLLALIWFCQRNHCKKKIMHVGTCSSISQPNKQLVLSNSQLIQIIG